MGKRRPIYFSPLKDNDLIEYIGKLESSYTFGHTVKELMRDGMKYRRLIETGQLFENGEQPKYYKVLQSNTIKKGSSKPKQKQDLSHVKLERSKVDKEGVGSRLLNF